MNKYELTKVIEEFAPIETQESWDCSGWIADNFDCMDVKKIMLALTPNKKILTQARTQGCDMIISHHPMFFIERDFFGGFKPDMNMYCAHTNFDKANGGTTDIIIDKLGLTNHKIDIEHEFLRFVDIKISVNDLNKPIAQNFKNARIINNNNTTIISRIAFCAGSGSDFIEESADLGADCLVTGDVKYHCAVDSKIVLYDIGHFQSEIICLEKFKEILAPYVETVVAQEIDPFVLL